MKPKEIISSVNDLIIDLKKRGYENKFICDRVSFQLSKEELQDLKKYFQNCSIFPNLPNHQPSPRKTYLFGIRLVTKDE